MFYQRWCCCTGENMVSKQASQTAENRQKKRRDDNQRKLEAITYSDADRFKLQLDRKLFKFVIARARVN